MIPGHNLVAYMSARSNDYAPTSRGGRSHRGCAALLGLLLYDMASTDAGAKVGALFWRMQTAGPIIFSLKFHMGHWSPREAIDFLVDRVGHDRDNATAGGATLVRVRAGRYVRCIRRPICWAGCSCAACARSWWRAGS